MNWYGIAIGIGSFFIIGVLHPVVIKVEYYFGKKVWPAFLLLGIDYNVVSLAVGHIVISVLLAVLGFSLFWSIGELRQQKERVKKGWFPKNPKKK
ncbi:DUF4491 family protein [Clostridium botulinum]|uniref:DUF4491 domain-containing protein n=1 Tax=Clostridium botulinum CFSAN001627 TaxID=1232189 RepID=M1ZZQ9_CLOBO|nr:DUF4491 family protein [Clostridium botulinum]EKN43125.1 hypothetical protein CFSAN001627_02600 [Clostridium botulinum CFSAN001627]APC82402.1 hypothetical protein NPD12_811 [Clostridium botulinum]APH21416.1 hypothetical protein NPD1_1996 [Clostridium botulinum]APQ69163.1 hypothetical protein RSJ8_125 [Clostridium botulinum]AUN05829.1 DUF4491 domain-containing protein [Clostridium botulinum]